MYRRCDAGGNATGPGVRRVAIVAVNQCARRAVMAAISALRAVRRSGAIQASSGHIGRRRLPELLPAAVGQNCAVRFEIRSTRKGIGGSNPSLSANNKKAGSSPALLRGAPGALLRGTLAGKLVDLIGRALLHPGQHVLINVQRDGTVCVAKAPGHDPDIDPHADQQ